MKDWPTHDYQGGSPMPHRSEPTSEEAVGSAALALLMLFGKLEKIAGGDAPGTLEPHEARTILALIQDPSARKDT